MNRSTPELAFAIRQAGSRLLGKFRSILAHGVTHFVASISMPARWRDLGIREPVRARSLALFRTRSLRVDSTYAK